jgi:2'-5' RNA ligase
MATRALAGTDAIAINVLLEPDHALARVAVAANERLRAEYPPGFAFDASHVPHVTVLQRYVRKDMLEKAIAAVADVVGRSGVAGQRMTATGLYASAFAGVGMANIAVSATPELARLQEDLIVALAPFVVAEGGPEAFVPEAGGGAVNDATVAYVRDFVPMSSGANYKPHVTVGVGEPAVVSKLVNAPFAPLRFTVRSVSIYQLGNFGTARRRLWSFPDPQG